MIKRYTQAAFNKAVIRANDAHLPIVSNKAGWFVQSQDGHGAYLVRFDNHSGEWKCPCKATVPCIHCGAAFIAVQAIRAAEIVASKAVDEKRSVALLARHDNTGPRWMR